MKGGNEEHKCGRAEGLTSESYWRLKTDATAFEVTAAVIGNLIVNCGAEHSSQSLMQGGRFDGFRRDVLWESLKSVSHFNLGIALELRLKGLLHLEHPEVPPRTFKGHGLARLFSKLEDGTRKKLNAAYLEYKEADDFELLTIRPPGASWPESPKVDDLLGFLEFLDTWVNIETARYSWETVDPYKSRFYLTKEAAIINLVQRAGQLADDRAKRLGLL